MAETGRRIQVLANLKCLFPDEDTDVLTISYPTTRVRGEIGYQALAVQYNLSNAPTSLLQGDPDAPSRKKAMQSLLKTTENELYRFLGEQRFKVPIAGETLILKDQIERDGQDHGSEGSEEFEFIATPEESSAEEDNFGEVSDVGRKMTAHQALSASLSPEDNSTAVSAPNTSYKAAKQADLMGETSSSRVGNTLLGKFPVPSVSDTILESTTCKEDYSGDEWAFWVAAYLKKQKENEISHDVENAPGSSSTNASETYLKETVKQPHGDEWALWVARHVKTQREKESIHSATLSYPRGSGDAWAYWWAKSRKSEVEEQQKCAKEDTEKEYRSLTEGHCLPRRILRPHRDYPPGSKDEWAWWTSKGHDYGIKKSKGKESNKQLAQQPAAASTGAPLPILDFPPGSRDTWAHWVASNDRKMRVGSVSQRDGNPKSVQVALEQWITVGVPLAKLKKLQQLINESDLAKVESEPVPGHVDETTMTKSLATGQPKQNKQEPVDEWALWAAKALKEKTNEKDFELVDSNKMQAQAAFSLVARVDSDGTKSENYSVEPVDEWAWAAQLGMKGENEKQKKATQAKLWGRWESSKDQMLTRSQKPFKSLKDAAEPDARPKGDRNFDWTNLGPPKMESEKKLKGNSSIEPGRRLPQHAAIAKDIPREFATEWQWGLSGGNNICQKDRAVALLSGNSEVEAVAPLNKSEIAGNLSKPKLTLPGHDIWDPFAYSRARMNKKATLPPTAILAAPFQAKSLSETSILPVEEP